MASIQERIRQAIDAHVPAHLRPYFYQMTVKEGASGKDSPTGAAGPLQFTRGTGKKYGLVGPQGDIRRDVNANIKAGVGLTLDNAAVLRRHLGRDPTYSELALAHQQGADTAGKMLTGKGNAPRENLVVNKVDPNLPPQEAAKQIMNYYGFNKLMPNQGLTLNSDPTAFVDPNAPGAFTAPAQAPAGSIPYMGAFTPPPGKSLMSNPVDVASAAGTTPASFSERALGVHGQGSKGTPYGNALAGLEDVAKGLSPKSDPRLNDIAPSTASAVDTRIASQMPLAQSMLTQMIQQMQQRRGR
jgi:hypothetical protein